MAERASAVHPGLWHRASQRSAAAAAADFLHACCTRWHACTFVVANLPFNDVAAGTHVVIIVREKEKKRGTLVYQSSKLCNCKCMRLWQHGLCDRHQAWVFLTDMVRKAVSGPRSLGCEFLTAVAAAAFTVVKDDRFSWMLLDKDPSENWDKRDDLGSHWALHVNGEGGWTGSAMAPNDQAG